jgi:hypothetical protein
MSNLYFKINNSIYQIPEWNNSDTFTTNFINNFNNSLNEKDLIIKNSSGNHTFKALHGVFNNAKIYSDYPKEITIDNSSPTIHFKKDNSIFNVIKTCNTYISPTLDIPPGSYSIDILANTLSSIQSSFNLMCQYNNSNPFSNNWGIRRSIGSSTYGLSRVSFRGQKNSNSSGWASYFIILGFSLITTSSTPFNTDRSVVYTDTYTQSDGSKSIYFSKGFNLY